jgi:hypothetical protein
VRCRVNSKVSKKAFLVVTIISHLGWELGEWVIGR